MDKVIVVGGGGHAKCVISLMKKTGKWEMIGYTDRADRGVLLGVPRLGDDDLLKQIRLEHEGCHVVIGVGCVKVSDVRRRLRERLEAIGFLLPAIVSPDAIVNEGVTIGRGSVVFDGVVINPGTTIGDCAIINSNSTVEHDCRIGHYVHVAPGATLSGGTTIGEGSFVGAGATIIQNITVTENCLIGAGAVVVRDCLTPGTYVGAPARITR